MRPLVQPLGWLLPAAILGLSCEDPLPHRTWTAVLEVKVRDSVSHLPLEGALVVFANDTIELSPPDHTGEAGLASYEIEVVKGNEVRLDVWRVEKSGYLTWNRTTQAPFGATLTEEEPEARVELWLTPLP